MKKIIIMYVLIMLIKPSLLYAESSCFLACQEGKITYAMDKGESHNFKRGDIFFVQSDSTSADQPKIIEILLGERFQGNAISHFLNPSGLYQKLTGFVDLKYGCWIKFENNLPIKNKASVLTGIAKQLFSKDRVNENYLDGEFVDVICSEHLTQFYVDGKKITDVKMKKAENLEQQRLMLVRNEEIRQKQIQLELKREAEIRQKQEENERIQRDKENRIKSELRKYKVQSVVSGQDLMSNPFRYKGKTVATPLIFIRMIEESVGVFGVGNPGYPTDDIIVSNLPAGLFGDNSLLPLFSLLVVKVQGTIPVTNRYGAKFNAPHLEYVAIVYSKSP